MTRTGLPSVPATNNNKMV